MGGIEERWDDPSKPAECLGSAEEWHHVSSGRREKRGKAKSTSIAESWCAKDSAKAVYSADHKFYF